MVFYLACQSNLVHMTSSLIQIYILYFLDSSNNSKQILYNIQHFLTNNYSKICYNWHLFLLMEKRLQLFVFCLKGNSNKVMIKKHLFVKIALCYIFFSNFDQLMFCALFNSIPYFQVVPTQKSNLPSTCTHFIINCIYSWL